MLSLLHKYNPLVQLLIALLGFFTACRMHVEVTNSFYLGQPVVESEWVLAPVPTADRAIRVEALPARSGPSPGMPGQQPGLLPAAWDPPVPIQHSGFTGHVFVLSQEFAWVRGETGGTAGGARIEYYGEVHPLSKIDDYLLSPGLQEQIHQATDVIAVGLASCEGRHEEERERAATRAEALAARLRAVYPPGKTLGSLQLWEWSWGRHGADCPGAPASSTRGQRRIVIVALRREPGTDLREEDLRREMQQSPALRVRPADYPFPGPLRSAHH